jgi:lysophospholipase L1-like esterase
MREVIMSRTTFASLVAALAAVSLAGAGCSDDSNPFGATLDGGLVVGADAAPGTPDATPGTTPDAGGGAVHKCPAVPKRVIVLGDSITNCTVIGGPNSADCVSKQFFDHVKAKWAPDAQYVNVAVGGATTSGIAQQMAGITTGPGAVLVMIYIGGNDLAPYIFQSDSAAMAAFNQIMPGIKSNWDDIFAFFEDKAKFPDGATIVMNNQYNPFDDCTAPPYNLSALKSNLLHMFNAVLQDFANDHFEHTIIVDQYTSYLGHGHHYDVSTCPHYMAGATPYMKDLIHANADGNKHLSDRLNAEVDALFTDCMP